MKPTDNVEKLIRDLHVLDINTNAEMDQQILHDTLKVQQELKQTKLAGTQPDIWRIIMKSSIEKLAIAAIIVAIGLGTLAIIDTGSKSGVVWAEVVEQVQASPGFTCRSNVILTNTASGNSNQIDMRMYGSSKYGIRVDQYENGKIVISNYGNRADNTIVSITHPTKTYTREPLLENDIANLEQMSPSKLVQQYLSTDYKELESDMIDGLEVEGIEVNDPSVISTTFSIDSIVARLWVSKETGFPVRMEAKMTGNNGALKMEAVMNELRWNVEFNASDFTPDIPSDYTLIETPSP